MSNVLHKGSLPDAPTYARLLLARAPLTAENPAIYAIDYLSFFEPDRDPPRRQRWTWHWRTPRGPIAGLSIVIRYSNAATLRREWREMATLLKLDRSLFESIFIKRGYYEEREPRK